MMRRIKVILKFSQRLTVFDWLAILIVSLGLVFVALFLFKEERWITAEVKVAPLEWWWASKDPPPWLADRIEKGDIQYDRLGRKIAEVLEVRSWEVIGESDNRDIGRKPTYLTLRVNVEVDPRKNSYKFNNEPLEIGGKIGLDFGGIAVPGLVTYVEGLPDDREWGNKVIEAKLIQSTDIFPETQGVSPWIADAILVGDTMDSTQGEVIAEILEKRVKPADKIVVTSTGRVFVNQDPIKKDVTLVIKLKTVKQEGVDYFLDDILVKVGIGIFISLPDVVIWPHITKIIQ